MKTTNILLYGDSCYHEFAFREYSCYKYRIISLCQWAKISFCNKSYPSSLKKNTACEKDFNYISIHTVEQWTS